MTDSRPKTLRTTTPVPRLTLSDDAFEVAHAALDRERFASSANVDPAPLDAGVFAYKWASYAEKTLDNQDYMVNSLRMRRVFHAAKRENQDVSQEAWRVALTQFSFVIGFAPNMSFVGKFKLSPAAFDFALSVAAAATRVRGWGLGLEDLVDLNAWHAPTPPATNRDADLATVLAFLAGWATSPDSGAHPAGLCFAHKMDPSHFFTECERHVGLPQLIAACEQATDDPRFPWWVLASLKTDVPWETYEARKEALDAWLARGASRDVVHGLPKSCQLRVARAVLDGPLTRHLLEQGVQLRIWHVAHALRDAMPGDVIGAIATNYRNAPLPSPTGLGRDGESGLGWNVPSSDALALYFGPGAPGLLDFLIERDLEENNSSITRTLSRMSSPRLVAHFYDILQRKKKRDLWPDLEEFMEWDGANAIAGLIALAERKGKRRMFALEYLRGYIRRGHQELVEVALTSTPDALAALIRDELFSKESQALVDATTVTGGPSYQAAAASSPTLDLADAPDWLAAILALPPEFPLDPRLEGITWPAVRLAGADTLLPPDALAAIARAIRTLTDRNGQPERPVPELDDVAHAAYTRATTSARELAGKLDPQGADALWCVLFHHAPIAPVAWALSVLGGPASFERAGQIIRKDSHCDLTKVYPSDLTHALLTRDDPAAWAELLSKESIGRHTPDSWSSSGHIKKVYAQLEERHGWDRRRSDSQLAPAYGLGPDGAAHFGYGARVLTMRVDSSLQVVVSDDTGKVYRSLPSARKGENRRLVATHKRRMKWMRAILERAIADASARFEDELRDMYPRTLGDLREHILSHPWRQFFVRSLIWGTYDGLELDQDFLCDADGSLMGPDFDTLELPDDATVRLVHPIELTEDARLAWSQVLADSEIVQPFPQLQRPVLGPDDWEAERTQFAKASLGRQQFLSKQLRAMDHWVERSTRHGTRYGSIWFPERAFSELGVRARLLFDARQWDFSIEGELEKTDGLYVFASASDTDPDDFRRVRHVPLDEIPPRIASELMLLLRG